LLRGSTSLRRRTPIHCAWRETDWGEGITTTTLSLHLLFICRVSRFALFTHSSTPLAVFCRRRPLRPVQMVIMWTAPLTDHIASGVTAKKTITRYRYYPIYSNIAQFPITQYRYRSNPIKFMPEVITKNCTPYGCGRLDVAAT